MAPTNEQGQGVKKILSKIDWSEIARNSNRPMCLNDVVVEVCGGHAQQRKLFVSGAHGTDVAFEQSEADSETCSEGVPWDAEKGVRNIEISHLTCLPARELLTGKPVNEPVPILPMLRWSTMPDDPNSQLLECDSTENLIATITPSFEQCATFKVPMSLIVVGLPDLTEGTPVEDWQKCDLQEQLILEEIFAAIKENGMLIRFEKRLVALFLLRVDQFIAGKVCQRIKESVRRLAFFKLHLDREPTLRFGVSEHQPGGCGNAERLVREAINNMDLAEHLGSGAIVREADKKLSLEYARPSAHFGIGDLLSRQSKQKQADKY